MARCYALWARLTGFYFIFNVDQSVGNGCPNNRNDVLLVQYMLAVWLSRSGIPHVSLKGKLPVKIDGIYGEETKAYIKALEDDFPAVIADGRIDPLDGNMSTGSGMTKKLWVLNNQLFADDRLHGYPVKGPIKFPTELESSIYR